MATKPVAVAFRGRSVLKAAADNAVSVSADFDGRSRLDPTIGRAQFVRAGMHGASRLVAQAAREQPVTVAFRGSSVFVSDPGARVAVAVDFRGEARLAVQFGEPKDLAVDFRGGSRLAATIGLDVALAVAFRGAGTLALWWDYPLPEVRDPLPGEFPGAVNLDRNPSLEEPAFGLTDWAADAGVALDIDATAEAWHGTRSAKATVAASGSAKRVRIASQAGLANASGRAFVASVWLAGDPDDLPLGAGEPVGIAVWLRAEYADGTATDGTPLAYVPPGEPPDWMACPTEPVATDPTKVLDRLVTVVEVPALAAGADLWLDGSQKEEDRGQRGTPFASGDMGAGHRWAGIAGLSPSIREPLPIGGGS